MSANSPIRVLQFICPTGFYGAERWILALANNLNPNDVHCELVVTVDPGQSELQIVEAYKALNLPVHCIQTEGRFDRQAIKRLAELMRKRKIDVIHTHGYKSDILGLLAARKAKVRSVCTPHGFENTRDLKLRLFIWLGCQSFRFFDAVVPLSRDLEKVVRSYGVNKQRCTYIQNGVDLKDIMAISASTLTSGTDGEQVAADRIIGFVGQMISRKNIKDLLWVFDQLYKAKPNTRLLLLGDGDARTELEHYAKTLDSCHKIEFLGFRSDRITYMRSFDLFVMSSSLEGIPRCLMEALALGIPTAAYDIAGVDQLVLHEQTGLLAPFGDREALLKHWHTLLADAELARRLGEQGCAHVNEAFSAARMASEYTTLFKGLLFDGEHRFRNADSHHG